MTTGNARWATNGGLLAGAGGSQLNPASTVADPSNAIVVWEDTRTGARDIYAQHTGYTNGLCGPAAVADFSAAETSGSFPLTVHFTDQSTGPAISWQWDFENDGLVDATEQNPTHVYSVVGTYSVALTVSDGGCPNRKTRVDYISVTPCTTVTASFVADTLGVSPFTVHFTDQSTGPVSQWQWDFGADGTIEDTSQNPTRLYTVPGFHSVALTVSDGHCFSKQTRVNYIHVLPCTTVTVGFSTPDTLGGNPYTVHFTDQSTGPINSWKWDFENDGTIDATIANPVHVYPNPGLYSVALTVSDGPCEKTLVRSGYINVLRTYRDSLILGSDHPATSDTARVPVIFSGKDTLGAVAIYLNVDGTKLKFDRFVPGPSGRAFTGGVRTGKVVLQWFDTSGGANPIIPGTETLGTLVFAHQTRQSDSTLITFDPTTTRIASVPGIQLTDLTFIDRPPNGVVVFPTGTSTISGQVRHYLSAAAVPRTSVVLTPPGSNASTDADGWYSFPGPAAGRYVLRASKTDDLGGINSLDGLKILRYAAGLEILTANQILAADVNRDGIPDALDALTISRVALGLGSFITGDWKLLPDSLVIPAFNHDATTMDFTALRYGDVNGDWTPGPEPFLVSAETATSPIRLWIPDADVAPGALVRVPLRIAGLDRAGAVSLRLRQDGGALAFTGVSSAIEGVTFLSNRVGNEIRIEWFDASGGDAPISIDDGTLLTLAFQAVGEVGDSCTISIGAASAFGDIHGTPIRGLELGSGRVRLTRSPPPGASRFELQPVTPNPARAGSRFRFTLAREARTSLGVYDVRGSLVRALVEASLPAGEHFLDFDGRDGRGGTLRSGMYFVKLFSAGETRTRKFVLLP